MLSRLVQLLEAETNDWLGKISGGGLHVVIASHTETKRGDNRNVVSLSVKKEDHSLPYVNRSAGERRRVDVALGFALRSISDAAEGSPGGTLFADEIFDGLDEAGRETVMEGLLDMAKTRCVVLISHAASFVERSAVARYHLTDGALERR